MLLQGFGRLDVRLPSRSASEYKHGTMLFDAAISHALSAQFAPAPDDGQLTSALSVLTAMITPAVLISACGTLILSTSTRLGRVVDRVRALSDRIEELALRDEQLEFIEDRRALVFDQLDRLTSRARLLQRCMTIFYLALAIFVATSVLIGIVAATSTQNGWMPVVMGLTGACFLFYGSILLIFEARLAYLTIRREMDFIWQFSKRFVPEEMIGERHRPLNLAFKRAVRRKAPRGESLKKDERRTTNE